MHAASDHKIFPYTLSDPKQNVSKWTK